MIFPFSFLKSALGSPAPVLTSLDFDLADTAGGDSITITGTDLGSATACTVGGTSATITANTSTSLTFTMPAKAAGSYNVQVTTAGGASNTLSIEAWDPLQISGIDGYFDSRKGVSVDISSNVTSWTEQSRSASYTPPSTAPTKVASVFGASPSVRFTQSSGLTAVWRALASGTTAFFVAKWTSSDTASNAYAGNNPLTVIGDNSGSINHSVGCSAGQIDYAAYDGAWNHILRGSSLNDGTARLCGITHASLTGDIKAYVGTTQQGSTASVTYTASEGWDAIGGGYSGGAGTDDGFAGDIGAAIIVNGVISGADLTKLYKWSKAGFGVA